ncbi:hypothetical protein SAMN05216319_5007 [Duganella sp. CF402]|uniref:hypothetical protein n=1 Tax=unclassified Duganella TaxID=2636909 RepID=UPI0008B03290|nr:MULTISPECIES: hypothetical protein [unclassified Duganella]RZT05695.1 hypothetical protein EV582_4013 [Duganella sp. BK701]SEM94476.1 hypothetical protein SAMN05216319_5007 [Duganella sp. CF402]
MSARATRATSAVDRLKRRTGNQKYSMSVTGSGHFFISEGAGNPPLCAPMELDDFVAFVNGIAPAAPKRISKLDVAFEKQLTKK